MSKTITKIEIIDYKPQHKDAFRRLNYEWLEKYFVVEGIDKEVLLNPEAKIIEPGGKIFFARNPEASGDDEIIGTCALMKLVNGDYELTKMAVTEGYRGLQIGKRLGERVLDEARKMGLTKVILETNSQLTPAISLYHKLGFRLLEPDPNSKYQRADVRMEIDLT